MNSLNNLEYHRCRTCYDSTSNLQLITSNAESSSSQDDQKSYAQLLLQVCNINVMEDKPLDQWPQFICFNCSHKLIVAHDFIQHTHKINKLLKSIADLLKEQNKMDFIEKPELDIPLDFKMEKDEFVEVLPNERVFQYSPIESEVLSAETTRLTYDKFESIPHYDNIVNDYQNGMTEYGNKSIKEIIVPSTIEYIDNGAIIDDTLDNKSKLNMNSTNSNSNASLACSQCNKLFTSIYNLNRHRRFTHVSEENKVLCPICDLKFSRPYHLKRHLKTVHKPQRKIVDTKSKRNSIITTSTNKSKTRKTNSRVSTKVADLTCNICKKVFVNRRKFSCHKRLVHVPEEKKITCQLCGTKLGRADNFKRHMKTLHGTDVYSPQKNLVKVKEVRFFCDKCERSYTRRSSLYKHTRVVHGK